MTDDIRNKITSIAYSEGRWAYKDGVNLTDNPYKGVSNMLQRHWCSGWWDTFYEDL